MKANPNDFQILIDITPLRVADLLCSGFEGGIGYWGSVIDYRVPVSQDDSLGYHKGTLAAYPVSPGGAVFILDKLEGPKSDAPMVHHTKSYILDRSEIQGGLKLMSMNYPRHFGNFLSGNEDAETGDVFIQCCIFGEVIYG